MLNAKIDHGLFSDTWARPHLIQADDGQNYIVKFPRDGNIKSIFNEYLGGKLAKHFGISVLDPVPIHLDEDFIINSPEIHAMGVAAGPYFATLKQNDVYNAGGPVGKRMEPKKIVNLDEVVDFVAFDIYLCNNDRNDGNSILVATSEARTKFKYLLIDHGWCFNGPDWSIDEISSMPYKISWIPWKKDGVTSQLQFNTAVNKITLEEAEFDVLLALLPVEWRLTAAETDALKRALTNRDKDKIMEVINDNRGQFPNWR